MTTVAETAPTRKRRSRRAPAIVAAVLLVLTGYTIWSNVRVVTLTASLDIPAPADRVWAVLTDFRSYPGWNPFMVSAEVASPDGTLAVDATLRIVLRDAGGDMSFEPTVLAVEPGKELRWLGKLGPGWIADGEHEFTLQALGPDSTRLVQTERFTGVAVPFAESTLRDTERQFDAMNRALAIRASS
ncbi:SRPBCC family protein [Amycolatopsis sp. lyj-112]|uniref:SRPBCC family protein n=1 Tax=Amycolatopsis sp. lyj-112 TaxID=2789288 RepID=UPI0039792C72